MDEIFDFETIPEGEDSYILDFIRTVKFSEILDSEKGDFIDSVFEEEGWELQLIKDSDQPYYQVFFGRGVQVDNLYEYGFPHLYELDQVIGFAEDFYIFRKSLLEESNRP